MAWLPSYHPVAFEAQYDLYKVMRPNGYIYASSDKLFEYAFFGRDAIEVCEDLLEIKPSFIPKTIVRLAELQGVSENSVTEEEPGKIHHEHRALFMEGRRVSKDAVKKLQQLSAEWGLDEHSFTYYGSADATPLYVRLVARYVQRYGDDILSHRVRAKDESERTVADSIESALGWIAERLRIYSLMSFQHQNPRAIVSQVWKDSPSALVHRDGTLPNFMQPIATIELQGLAYDALMLGAQALEGYDRAYADRAREWKYLAQQLGSVTLEKLWMEHEGHFATGMDFDEAGRERLIVTNTSNQGSLLESTLLDMLPVRERDRIVRSLVANLYSPHFLTSVGIRCRSLEHLPLVDFQDYHGIWAVWVKETYDIAKGLRHQGYGKLADQLELRILKGVSRAGECREFFYVSPHGKVLYQPQKHTALHTFSRAQKIHGTNIPETAQAWSVSAVHAICRRKPVVVEPPNESGKRLESLLLSQLPRIDPKIFLMPNRLMGFLLSQRYGVDTASGKRFEDNWQDRARGGS